MEEKKLELYKQILDSSEQIRTEIMKSVSDIILFGGQISEEDNKELGAIAKITGETFQALIDKGIPTKEVTNKQNFISITINDKDYLCHTSVIPSFQKKTNFVDTVDKERDYVEEDSIGPEQVSTVEIKEEFYEEEDEPQTPDNSLDLEDISLNSDSSGTDESTESGTDLTEKLLQEESSKTDVEETSIVKENNEEKENDEEMDVSVIPVEEQQAPVTHNTQISQFSRNNLFIEENTKPFNEFILTVYRITALHQFGGRAEEMQVMIAPLKISKSPSATVPIIVSIYYKGRTFTKSSYDTQEEGKNLVQIDVNDFYFLCRGGFNEKGEFTSNIMTTGISAGNGDKINILSRKEYGNSKNSNVNNGHIKFRYMSEEGPGTIEVFPLAPGEQDFIIMSKNEEFIDYLAISPNGYNRPFIYENGIKKEVLCNWDDMTLEVELVEV